ncbi:hypothetical protein M0805_002244, partial [Coniferiporia weirii]
CATQKLGVRVKRFRCLSYTAKTASLPDRDGPNAHLIRLLMREIEMESRQGKAGVYKARALQRAIGVLNLHNKPITSGHEAMQIIGIGEGIARRIDDYFQPDREPSVQDDNARQLTMEEVKRERSLAEFRRVPGIGPVRALKLYNAGCRSLADLRKPEHFNTLSAPCKVSLEYVGHLEQRATRAQVEAVMRTVKPLVSAEVRMHIVGSYRRGLLTCADIDVIIFHPSCVYVPLPGEKPSTGSRSSTLSGRSAKPMSATRARQDTFLRQFVLSPLERAGVIAATLSEGPQKWQGIVRVPDADEGEGRAASVQRKRPSVFRRMDLSLFPVLSEGAALLATTGDKDFNLHLRGVASKMGLHLNEYGLWRRRPSPTRENSNGDGTPDPSPPSSGREEDDRWDLVASVTEQEVLRALEVNYVEPERRNFAYVMSRSEHGSLLKTPGSVVKGARSRPQKLDTSGD